MNTQIAFVVAAGVIAIAALVCALARKRRTAHLKERFGSEYDRSLAVDGKHAESLLSEREKRVEKLQIHPVPPELKREADISVDHPGVMQNYRAAHELALKRQRGEASTEDLRQAFVHYRSLFDELLELPALVPVQ